MGERMIYEMAVQAGLTKTDAKRLERLPEFFAGKHPAKLASKLFVFQGPPGVGKTYLADKLVQVMDVPVLYVAHTKKGFGKKFADLDCVLERWKPGPKIVYLDDLGYILEQSRGEVEFDSSKAFMRLLDTIRADDEAVLLATMNDGDYLHRSMVDRINVKITFHAPPKACKLTFLEEEYGEYFSKKMLKCLAEQTEGYSYRDLEEVVRRVYDAGADKLDDVIKSYTPSFLEGYTVERDITSSFSDVFGKKDVLKVLNRTVQFRKGGTLLKFVDTSRYNLLLFEGPAGTGKSFTVKALAGELGYPIISINASELLAGIGCISNVMSLVKRFKNYVFFIDEAEKLFGGDRFGIEDYLLGEFNREIEGVSSEEIKSVLILAINDGTRFGAAFRDRFVSVPFSYPTYEERLAYCMQKGTGLDWSIDYSLIAKRTKGKSFRAMDRIWSELLSEACDEGQATDVMLRQVLNKLGSREADRMFG